MKITTIIVLIKLLEGEIDMAKYHVKNITAETEPQKVEDACRHLAEVEAAYADLNRAIANKAVALEV